MKPLFLDEYELTASMPLRALEKLGDGGVSVYDVQKIAPGKLKFRAKSKESEKILQFCAVRVILLTNAGARD